MLQITSVLLIALAFFAKHSTADPIKCGAIPLDKTYKCIGSPEIFLDSPEIRKKCPEEGSECAITKCYAEGFGWLDGDKLNKSKIISDYDEFAKKNPAWANAIAQTKADCLSADLPAQGIHLNCPSYDIYLCTMGALAKHAGESQWSSEAECQVGRTYAAACPPCPEACLSTHDIPAGACNACLPKTS